MDALTTAKSLPFCQDCGHQVGEGDNFCSSCGVPTVSDPEPSDNQSDLRGVEAWPREWMEEVDFDNNKWIQTWNVETSGFLNNQVTVALAVSTYMVGLFDTRDRSNIRLLTGLPLVELDDVVVVNKHSESSRTGLGFYKKGIGGWRSGGSSRTVGDIVFMSEGREIFRVQQIRDPYGVRNMVLSTRRQLRSRKS